MRREMLGCPECRSLEKHKPGCTWLARHGMAADGDEEEDVEHEPPPGMLPDGKLNIVNEDDPPFVPRIVPDAVAE